MKRYLALLTGLVLVAVPSALGQSIVSLVTNLVEPNGVAVDSANNFYITDSANNRILRFTPTTSTLTNLAGVPGTVGAGYVDGQGFQAKFNYPAGIVATRGGFVIADSGNHRIRFMDPNGVVSTLAGSGQPGFVDATGVNASFNSPAGLAADSAGNVYIADLINNSIRKLDINNVVTTIASNLNRPAAVAVDPSGNIYVADTLNNQIKIIVSGVIRLYAGSGVSGADDNLIATNATFNHPRGLLWAGGNTGLVVSDSGNRVLRQVFTNTVITNISVQTMSSTVGALLNPAGLAQDLSANILIADTSFGGSGALKELVATQPQPPVGDPVIGTVALVASQTGGNPTAIMTPVTSGIYNNDVIVAISSDAGSQTFYTLDGTIPTSSNGTTPPPYHNGDANLPSSIINTSIPNAPSSYVIKAVSTASGRVASHVVTAQFEFQVSNPAIIGQNAAAVSMQEITANAQVFYTTDGTDPTASSTPYTLGTQINITSGTNNVTLKARAFRNGYLASSVIAQTFFFNNVVLDTIGITNDFTAAPGSTVIVPVYAQLNPNDVLKSLQFRLEVNPVGNAPAPSPTALYVATTNVMLIHIQNLLAIGLFAGDFIPISLPSSTNMPTYLNPFPSPGGNGADLIFAYLGTNAGFNLPASGAVALLGVPIPATATNGQAYTIGVLFPSGTSDGLDAKIPLTNTPLHTITVSTNLPYLIGDTAQAKWYNSGNFGNGNLNNNDVNDAFYASLGIRVPFPNSDIFDAMDSYPLDSPGTAGGDGQISFNDWNTTLFRAVRLPQGDTVTASNDWVRVRGLGGTRQVVTTNLNFLPQLPAQVLTADASVAWHRDAEISAAFMQNVQAGQTVSVPVFLSVQSGLDVSGLQFRADVVPAAGAPPITEPLRFVPANGIAVPTLYLNGRGTVGCGWAVGGLNPSLKGRSLVGHVVVPIPASAQAGHSYRVSFVKPDGSTLKASQQLADYRFESVHGGIWVETLANESASVISDEWKLAFFGSVDSAFADPNADPDGDGVDNLHEYLAGSSPAKLQFHLLRDEWKNNLSGFHLKWFSQPGKNYVVEAAGNPVRGPWLLVNRVTADVYAVQEFMVPRQGSQASFFRLRQE